MQVRWWVDVFDVGPSSNLYCSNVLCFSVALVVSRDYLMFYVCDLGWFTGLSDYTLETFQCGMRNPHSWLWNSTAYVLNNSLDKYWTIFWKYVFKQNIQNVSASFKTYRYFRWGFINDKIVILLIYTWFCHSILSLFYSFVPLMYIDVAIS